MKTTKTLSKSKLLKCITPWYSSMEFTEATNEMIAGLLGGESIKVSFYP